jgi:hypothetical protein
MTDNTRLELNVDGESSIYSSVSLQYVFDEDDDGNPELVVDSFILTIKHFDSIGFTEKITENVFIFANQDEFVRNYLVKLRNDINGLLSLWPSKKD